MTTKEKTTKAIEPVTTKYHKSYAWMPGLNFGFVAFVDDQGRNLYELSLGVIRFIWSPEPLV